jgi:uncharacterized protein YaiL (DUF2058 family)
MAKTLQEQLLSMGLTDKKKAKQAEKQKKKNVKEARNGADVIDEAKVLADKAKQDKLARDKVLNAEKKAAAEEKAIGAQIKQLIKMNTISVNGDVAYNFTAGTKIKKIYVNDDIQYRLSRGKLAITSPEQDNKNFAIIPLGVAEKIRQRDQECFIYIAENQSPEIEEDDPYAAYQIPDDLMW